MNPTHEQLDPRFSVPGAAPTPWSTARDELSAARTYWLATVRTDGRPHVTTIAGAWLDGAVHFMTGATEQKARNLAGNPRVALTTGCNGWDGLDVVIEGEAVAVDDADRLARFATALTDKYDDFFGVRFDGGTFHAPGTAELLAFEVRPTRAFGFAKGASLGQTRWRWEATPRGRP